MMSREEKTNQLEKKIKEENKKEKTNKVIKLFFKIFLVLFLIFILLILYMHFIGTSGLVVREYKVESTTLPDNFHGFKIVHFSDLHYLTTINEKEINKTVDKINILKPDVVVFTGDLIDDGKTATDEELKALSDALNKIQSTTELYAIKGNHDYKSNYFDKVFGETNFKILDNSFELLYYHGNTPILITGIGSIIQGDCDIDKAFSYSGEDNLYTISLLHEPDLIDQIKSKYKVDLGLAGHSHNGQIRLPFIGPLSTIREGKKYPNQKYIIDSTELYVSGGLGTSGYEFRFFNRPSINLYRLTKKEA